MSHPLRLVFIGPPGVGKGTQASRIQQYYDLVHLSTGEILRSEVKSKSKTGLEAKLHMDQGRLVPDPILLALMEKRLQKNDCQKGYLLDGFPRTLAQAEGLGRILEKLDQELDAVISLIADEDELVRRLVLRGQTSGRSDDTPDVIIQRQHVYWDRTAPLLEFYSQRKLLKEVDGVGSIPEITERILNILN